MKIVALLCCLVVVAACDPVTGEDAGEQAGAATGGLDDIDALDDLALLDALLVQPFQPSPADTPGLRDAGQPTAVELGEAVNDLFARTGASEASLEVRGLVWMLAQPIRRDEPWVDRDGRRAVARAELQALLGESYEDFMRAARALWVLAEACLPDCEEADLWPEGRPLGAAEGALAEACAGVGVFEPDPEPALDTRSRWLAEGELAVSVARPPDGFEVVDELRDGGAMVSERADLSAEAASGWHLQLAAGDHTRQDPNIAVQSVLAPAQEICYLLLRSARQADRWHPDEAAVTVRGRPGVLRMPGDEQATLVWREADDLLMEVRGYGGARAADVLAVGEALRVERP